MSRAVDLHVDTLWRLDQVGGGLATPRPELHVDAERCRAGSLGLLVTACFSPDDEPEPAALVGRMVEIARTLDADPAEPFRQVRTPEELAALEPDTVGLLLAIENARSLEGDLDGLSRWYEQGFRSIGITWNGANDLASGVGAASDDGLTPLGFELVQEAARLGMAIDLSHLAPRGVTQVLDADVPVLATHCNARAVFDHARNLTDDQLRRLADRGGIVGLNFFPRFLSAEEECDLSAVARHALHLAEVIGPEHIALGTDLDGIERTPVDFHSHADLPRLDAALAEAGFDAGAREGILGGNFLRWWNQLPRS